MGPVVSYVKLENDACIACGMVQVNKFDSTLMCSDEHATCFACVASHVQPHSLCGELCNGFKYTCNGCDTWLCINRTQELAVMCGSHALARERLCKEEIVPHIFDRTCVDVSSVHPISCFSSDAEEEEREFEDTCSSNSSRSSDNCGGYACDPARKESEGECCAQLPRVCSIDWAVGREQRVRRLFRLRASLLGHNI